MLCTMLGHGFCMMVYIQLMRQQYNNIETIHLKRVYY